MALPSTFQERLQQMEDDRNQRIFLLQAEKELQAKKTQLLAEKLSNLRRMEQRCLLLERRQSEIAFNILANKSEIDELETRSLTIAQEFRELWLEIRELEGKEKDKDEFYKKKRAEMKAFKEQVSRCVLDTRTEVEKLKNSVAELKSTLVDLQNRDGYQNNTEIAAAEQQKAELQAAIAALDKSLAANYLLKRLLHKQVQKALTSHGTRQGLKLGEEPVESVITDDKKTSPENCLDRFRLL